MIPLFGGIPLIKGLVIIALIFILMIEDFVVERNLLVNQWLERRSSSLLLSLIDSSLFVVLRLVELVELHLMVKVILPVWRLFLRIIMIAIIMNVIRIMLLQLFIVFLMFRLNTIIISLVAVVALNSWQFIRCCIGL